MEHKKYKIGDKLLIRKDLKEGRHYFMEDDRTYDVASSEMCKLGGEIATIKDDTHTFYNIDLDDETWSWTDEMFEDLTEKQGEKQMKFKKVSFEQYCKDCGYSEKFGDDLMEAFKEEYNDIKIPKRATRGSAGYDFFLPFDVSLEPNETLKIPTGIKWVTEYLGVVLQIYPRSGLGFKYQLGICNTVGIIDTDYQDSDNEGHIMIKLVNRGTERVHLKKGDGFAQGIISYFLMTDEDDAEEERVGGFGSTDKVE